VVSSTLAHSENEDLIEEIRYKIMNEISIKLYLSVRKLIKGPFLDFNAHVLIVRYLQFNAKNQQSIMALTILVARCDLIGRLCSVFICCRYNSHWIINKIL